MVNRFIKKRESEPVRPPDEELLHQLTRLNTNIAQSNRQASFVYSFWRAAIAALGATIGVTILLTIGLWVLNRLSFVPGVGAISHAVQQFNNQHGNR